MHLNRNSMNMFKQNGSGQFFGESGELDLTGSNIHNHPMTSTSKQAMPMTF